MKIKTIIIILSCLCLSNSLNRIAFVYHIEGECIVSNEFDDSRNLVANIGNSIMNNDFIINRENSGCQLLFDDLNTKIDLEKNAKILINDSKYGREIILKSGNIIVENSKSKIKTYVTTERNEIYINNNKVYIYVDDFYYNDKVFSTNQTLHIYNHRLKSNISVPPLLMVQINSDGTVLDDLELPDFFQDQISMEMYLENITNEEYQIYLNKGDLIPVYNNLNIRKLPENIFDIDYQFGNRNMQGNSYFKLGAYPKYRIDNFLIGANLELFIDSNGKMYDNWDSAMDLIEKIQFSYTRSNSKNDLYVRGGNIHPITFGHGYLVKDFSNSFNYPSQNNFGLNLIYEFDKDFIEFELFIPSVRDIENKGGIIAMHSSLYLSHKFPLTIGLGLVTDFNQMSSSNEVYNFSNQLYEQVGRKITAIEIDFNYEVISNMNLDISLYGEMVGIWYPDDIYYLQVDGSPYSDDLRWRKGTWGILGPGVSAKFNNRYELKLAFNYNSAGYLPSYFNYNYMHNRSIYYNTNDESLEFPLILEQIDMLNNFSISNDGEEYLIPKDIYPILASTFNPFPAYGFTGEFSYSYNKKVSISLLGSLYFQSTNNVGMGTYYSIDSKLSIKDGVIRNVSSLELYLSNIFFWSVDDRDKLIFGANMGFTLTKKMDLIFNLNQIYYDSNLNGSFNGSANLGLNFGVVF